MSRRLVPKLKHVPAVLSKAASAYSNIADIARTSFASARPKVDPSACAAQSQLPNSSKGHLSARSRLPSTLFQSLAGIAKQEERPPPQHLPDPSALMTPPRTANPATCLVQQKLLNGWRLPPRQTKDSEQNRITQRISELLGLDSMVFRDSVEDGGDQRGRSSSSSSSRMNIQQSRNTRNLRLEEDRQEVKPSPLAKNLGPPVTLKPKGYSHMPEESPYRPSATFLVASWFHHKSPAYPRLQGTPRSTSTCSNFKPNEELSRQQAFQPRYMRRPAYGLSTVPLSLITWKRPNNYVTPQPKYLHPINVVRPDIPPLYTTSHQVSEKVLHLEKAWNYQVVLSERVHKSRLTDWVAWIKRRTHF